MSASNRFQLGQPHRTDSLGFILAYIWSPKLGERQGKLRTWSRSVIPSWVHRDTPTGASLSTWPVPTAGAHRHREPWSRTDTLNSLFSLLFLATTWISCFRQPGIEHSSSGLNSAAEEGLDFLKCSSKTLLVWEAHGNPTELLFLIFSQPLPTKLDTWVRRN